MCDLQDRIIEEAEMNTILMGEARLAGRVEKLGMLPPRKWYAPLSLHCYMKPVNYCLCPSHERGVRIMARP